MSVTAAAGFRAAGIAAGIKASGALDLALVASDHPAVAAAVFTRNLVQAAPVLTSKATIVETGGRAGGVILNSGNANAATGEAGRAAAGRMAAAAQSAVGSSAPFLVCSTGLIGIPLDPALVEHAAPALAAQLAATPEGGDDAARAIMTTDTVPKQVAAYGNGWVVGGMAKGAAMLHPDMATMLAVITTDAEFAPDVLQRMLGSAVDDSFNRICTDGATSTNDTVVLLASGIAGPADITGALHDVCGTLAEQMVRDAEGATCFVEIVVTGARNDAEAVAAARSVARSALVGCSLFGDDPYWGRIASEIGSCGVAMIPDRLRIAYDGEVVCEGGAPVMSPPGVLASATVKLGDEVSITVDLGIGTGSGRILTSDLSHAYIDENMRTS